MEHSSTYRGVIKTIGEDYDNKSMARVEIELPEKKAEKSAKKSSKDAPSPVAYKPTRSVTVSQEMAASLSLGQAVECTTTLKPYGKFVPQPKAADGKKGAY